MSSTRFPDTWVLQHMHNLGQYLRHLFKTKLNGSHPVIHPFLETIPDAQLMAECYKMADMLVDAFKNPVKVPWDAVRYTDRITPKMTGRNGDAELELCTQFRPVSEGEPLVLDKPATLVDAHGIILAWYMPNLISLIKQEEMWKTCRHLDSTISKTIKNKSGKSWRTDPELFHQPNSCYSSVPGLLDFSPAWFMQAHDSKAFYPEVSASLKPRNKNIGNRRWLVEIGGSVALLSAILAVIHPELFDTGMEAMARLGNDSDNIGHDPDRPDVLAAWPTPFNGMSVIANRKTPDHRDTNSRAEWYDMLVTLGRYSNAYMEFGGLNVKLRYDGGTVVGFCGKVLQHRVDSCYWERICLAMYMRDNLHHRLGLPAASWMRQSHYIDSE